jgi:hypothetical protein
MKLDFFVADVAGWSWALKYIKGMDSNPIEGWRGRRGRNRMVVEFITTYAISAYHY